MHHTHVHTYNSRHIPSLGGDNGGDERSRSLSRMWRRRRESDGCRSNGGQSAILGPDLNGGWISDRPHGGRRDGPAVRPSVGGSTTKWRPAVARMFPATDWSVNGGAEADGRHAAVNTEILGCDTAVAVGVAVYGQIGSQGLHWLGFFIGDSD